MSQSATLYRISKDVFKRLNTPDNKQRFDINSAKGYSIFEGSFMGLEYILSKGQDNSTIELINEIFNPQQSIGGQDFDKLGPEEQFEFYESGLFIPYLDSSTISNLYSFINNVTQEDLHLKYDAKELNDAGIYPQIWHNNNSPDQAYNERHILEDFEELKKIISLANAEKDYILVYVG